MIDLPISSLSQYALKKYTREQASLFCIFCVLDGQIEIAVNDSGFRVYKTNDIVIISPQNQYSMKSEYRNQILAMKLIPSFVEKYIGPEYFIVCDSTIEPNRNYLHIKKVLSNIALKYSNFMPYYELSVYSMLFELLDILKREFSLCLMDTANEKKKDKQELRILEIKEYIMSNYQKDIGLTSLAEHLHLSPQYVSKIFKENFSLRFNQYVNSYRIQLAEREIKYSEMNITDIAMNNGFQNIALFNKYFRERYKLSPKEYRKRYHIQVKNTIEIPEVNKRNVFLDMDVQKELRQIEVDVLKTQPFSENLCKMINIGLAKNLLFENFQRQTTAAHRELGFQYVRIQWLVSSAMIPELIGTNKYYFLFLEHCLDYLKNEKLIPFVELSRSTGRYTGDGNGEWRQQHGQSIDQRFLTRLEAFLVFVTSHYDSLWYNEWIFELQKPSDETWDKCVKGFEKVKNLITKYIPRAKIGGIGYNIALPSEEFIQMLKAFKTNGVYPDFISVQYFTLQFFAYKNKNEKLCAYEAETLLVRQKWMIQKIKRILNFDCPLYITELNSSIIRNTYINHSCYQAAFLCEVILKLYKNSSFIGYWGLNDNALSLVNSSYLPANGLALINRNGIFMPSYFAYRFLKKLGNKLIEQGDNYCITKTDNDHYQVLAFHYVPFSDYFFLSSKQELKNVYKNFRKDKPLDVTVRLLNLPPGEYKVKRYLIDRFHGSFIDILLGEFTNGDIDEGTFLSKAMMPPSEEMEYLKSSCIPEQRSIYVTVEHGLKLCSPLFPHNVCLWEITKEI